MDLRHDEGSAVFAKSSEALLDQLLSLGVYSTGSLVEKNNLGLLQDCTGDSDTLFFTSG